MSNKKQESQKQKSAVKQGYENTARDSEESSSDSVASVESQTLIEKLTLLSTQLTSITKRVISLESSNGSLVTQLNTVKLESDKLKVSNQSIIKQLNVVVLENNKLKVSNKSILEQLTSMFPENEKVKQDIAKPNKPATPIITRPEVPSTTTSNNKPKPTGCKFN